MKIIVHRRNTRVELESTEKRFGVEVDLRSDSGHLVVSHDPFLPGEDFNLWLEGFAHSTLIVNVKEEGIEPRIISTLEDRGIEDFFFLDQSFPYLVRLAVAGERRSAVRVSEFESIETALALAGKIQWVWIDGFTEFPFSEEAMCRLITAGFKTCVVSPELQGRDPILEVPDIRGKLEDWKIEIDAVCTKRPDLWESGD